MPINAAAGSLLPPSPFLIIIKNTIINPTTLNKRSIKYFFIKLKVIKKGVVSQFQTGTLPIYSDMWFLRKKCNGTYEIANPVGEKETILTRSLYEFLERFLRGNVFDDDGLYEWQEAIGRQQ